MNDDLREKYFPLFRRNDNLPNEISPANRTILENAGIRFGEIVPNSLSMFRYVQLPAGWKKVETATDDACKISLMDDEDRTWAYMSCNPYDVYPTNLYIPPRFEIAYDPKEVNPDTGEMVGKVFEGGKVVHRTKIAVYKLSDGESRARARNKVLSEAKSWLRKEHPANKSKWAWLLAYPRASVLQTAKFYAMYYFYRAIY